MNQFEQLFDVSGLSLDRMRSFLKVAEAGNLSMAALGDQTKQSQYSRQIKELESFFGVALTRRVGRRIEITEEGRRLAMVVRRQFSELDTFREAMAGRCVRVSIGVQGSVLEWLLIPRVAEMSRVLGHTIIEAEQMRTMDIVRAVADGRLDFGIVREDALPPETKRQRIGSVGYTVFAANALWKGCASAVDLLAKAPVAELLPGGQFTRLCQQWLTQSKLRPQVVARVSSFTDLARLVLQGHAAAVLPEMSAVDFDPKKFKHQRITALKPRTLALIWNARSLDRLGIRDEAVEELAQILQHT
jgi:DNA-binding transcriptional LysR family regulator